MKSLQIPFLTLKTLCWFSFCCCRDGQCNVFLKNCPYILVTKVNRILKDSWACYIYFRTYFFVNILPNCLFCRIFCWISDGARVWASAGDRAGNRCTALTSLHITTIINGNVYNVIKWLPTLPKSIIMMQGQARPCYYCVTSTSTYMIYISTITPDSLYYKLQFNIHVRN